MLVSAPVGLVPFLWEILDLPLISVETFRLTLLFHTTRCNKETRNFDRNCELIITFGSEENLSDGG